MNDDEDDDETRGKPIDVDIDIDLDDLLEWFGSDDDGGTATAEGTCDNNSDDAARGDAGLPSPDTCGVIHPQALPAPMITRLIDALRLDDHRKASAPILLRSCLLSLSLSLAEKDRVTSELRRLDDTQIHDLTQVFGDEATEFTALVRHEFHIVANLQARALWNAMALMANRCGTSPRLERAWLRRTLRRCPAQGAFRRRLAAMDDAWWGDSVYARWAYRSLFERGHASWADGGPSL